MFKKKDPIKAQYLQAQVDDMRRHTPDAAVLMRYELQLLFVYDQMMDGMYEADKLGPEAMFGATAYTEADYVMWKKKLGLRSEAIVVQPKQNHRWSLDIPARVQGQIYAVRPEKIIALDKDRNNMVEFKRIRVRLIVPYREIAWVKDRDAIAHLSGKLEPNSIVLMDEKVCEVKAWMYIGTEYWDELFDGGFLFAPVQLFTPKSTVTRLGIKQYSRFTQLEYDE
jgi:hypothetical protein